MEEKEQGHLLKLIVDDFEEFSCNLLGRRQLMDAEGKATVMDGKQNELN